MCSNIPLLNLNWKQNHFSKHPYLQYKQQKNTKNPFVLVKNGKKIPPKNPQMVDVDWIAPKNPQMVDVDWIPPKLFHTYYNNRFALQIFTTNNSHNNLNMEITLEVCTSLVYWKFQSKYSKKFHVPLKCNQIARLNLWY
jgi:hypothetical protein